MAAQIGPPDPELYEDPHPALLERLTGITPEERGTHVLLDAHGVVSTQRLALRGVSLTAALWPAELKEQAEHLYGEQLATPMIRCAQERGWRAEPAPQLAFRSSAPDRRLYMVITEDALSYARRWEGSDFSHIGQYERAPLRRELWPWLKSIGFITDGDDNVFEEWIGTRLGNRPAFFRAGLRLVGSRPEVEALREDVNAILAAAGEPPLPASR
jgi:hypothetical protein